MAHHRLGNTAEASRDLARGEEILRTQFPQPGKADLGAPGEVLPLIIHLREARALILGDAAAATISK